VDADTGLAARRSDQPAAGQHLVGDHGPESGRSSTLAKCLLRENRAVRASRGPIISETVSMLETPDGRAVCGRTARTVRREGRRKPSLPLSGLRAQRPEISCPFGKLRAAHWIPVFTWMTWVYVAIARRRPLAPRWLRRTAGLRISSIRGNGFDEPRGSPI
jgi:hypothetical protein